MNQHITSADTELNLLGFDGIVTPSDHWNWNITSSATVQADLQTFVYAGIVFLSIGIGWKMMGTAPSSVSDGTLASLNLYSESRVRNSDEPLRSALLLRAAEEGVPWMPFDERMDLLTGAALTRLESYIDARYKEALYRTTEIAMDLSTDSDLVYNLRLQPWNVWNPTSLVLQPRVERKSQT
jgi:hypothetical protein